MEKWEVMNKLKIRFRCSNLIKDEILAIALNFWHSPSTCSSKVSLLSILSPNTFHCMSNPPNPPIPLNSPNPRSSLNPTSPSSVRRIRQIRILKIAIKNSMLNLGKRNNIEVSFDNITNVYSLEREIQFNKSFTWFYH